MRAGFFFALLFVFFCGSANAQKLLSVTGVTFQGASQQRVSGVTVGNFNKRTISISDEFGVFRIEAAVGDTLIFSKTQYTSQTLIVLNDNMLSIYMQPIVTLDEVTINDMSTRQELDATMLNYKRTGQYSRPGVLGSILSPVTGIYSLLGKGPARARRFEAFSKRELEDIEIEKKYNRDIIKEIIPAISNEDLDAFMVLFKPSYDQVKVWAHYDIIKYVQTSYDYYSKNKESLKPQKLY
ncbi:hypothetical protein [Mucilaginibacter auburnensis]|uniref:hypothetical protein n=1 Tax=Mucilaginibacter auburnensis TaxID=1457233 RepID=UPI0014766A26|nr:hypothetical protein [Mucilaginibacter auburnensis]